MKRCTHRLRCTRRLLCNAALRPTSRHSRKGPGSQHQIKIILASFPATVGYLIDMHLFLDPASARMIPSGRFRVRPPASDGSLTSDVETRGDGGRSGAVMMLLNLESVDIGLSNTRMDTL